MSKTKLLTIQEGNDFRIECSKIKDQAEIDALYDALLEESKNYTISVAEFTEENVQVVLDFFSKLKNVPFNLTAPFVTCYNQLKELIGPEAPKDAAINYNQIKVIQTMLVGASWDAKPEDENPLQEGENLLAALKALETANIDLGKIESKIQIAGVRSAEIGQENATGLSSKDAATDDTTKLIETAQEELTES